jgi:hypothetical protein
MSLLWKNVPSSIVSGVLCFFLGASTALVLRAILARPNAFPGVEAMANDGTAPPAQPNTGGSDPRAQLTRLVTRLDALTRPTPLRLELSIEQKKQLQAILADLESRSVLSEAEAKDKRDAILKVIEADRATLEAAGYRWPGQPPAVNSQAPNPFASGANADHLRALLQTLAK